MFPAQKNEVGKVLLMITHCGVMGDFYICYAFLMLSEVFILNLLATTPFLWLLFTKNSLQGLFILTISTFSLEPNSDRPLPLLLH